MSRVKDVDTVAPDDPIVNPQPSSPKKTVTSVTLSAPVVEAVVPEEVVPELAEKIYSVFGHTTTPFSSSLVMPKIFSFTEKNDNETILLALRSHWFTNVPWVLTFIVMLFVPNLIGFVPTISLAANLKIIISLSWYLITFAYAFEQFLSWYFDVFIVTDHRVVDIAHCPTRKDTVGPKLQHRVVQTVEFGGIEACPHSVELDVKPLQVCQLRRSKRGPRR